MAFHTWISVGKGREWGFSRSVEDDARLRIVLPFLPFVVLIWFGLLQVNILLVTIESDNFTYVHSRFKMATIMAL